MNVPEWISRNCRFAQQQQLLQFDPEEDWQDNPTDSHVIKDVEETLPMDVEKEEFLDGFYHVTTNLPAVLHWGALKSRSQLGGNVPGLGGGIDNAASTQVSLTYNSSKAYEIYEGLMFASDVAHDRIKASDIFDYLLHDHDFYDEIPRTIIGTLIYHGVPKAIFRDESYAGLEAALDKIIVGGESKYEFMQAIEKNLSEISGEYDDPSFMQSIVGLTVDYATFSQINPANIAILKMQIRKGAPFEHVHSELELRFDPDDVRLAPNPVIRRQ